MSRKKKTKIEQIAEKGYKRLDKFYSAKSKTTKRTYVEDYMREARIDNCVKVF
jgi:hypothetical protein